MQSNSEAVREFTEAAGTKCPDKPKPMTREDVMFLVRMKLSEIDELVCTVTENAEECEKFLQEALSSRDPCKNFKYETETELIAAQFDALVDDHYYSLNVSARHGVNLDRVFGVVHDANMAKRDPTTGKFLRRESDGKILKPAGWKAPDIEAEIERQKAEGAWN